MLAPSWFLSLHPLARAMLVCAILVLTLAKGPAAWRSLMSHVTNMLLGEEKKHGGYSKARRSSVVHDDEIQSSSKKRHSSVSSAKPRSSVAPSPKNSRQSTDGRKSQGASRSSVQPAAKPIGKARLSIDTPATESNLTPLSPRSAGMAPILTPRAAAVAAKLANHEYSSGRRSGVLVKKATSRSRSRSKSKTRKAK